MVARFPGDELFRKLIQNPVPFVTREQLMKLLIDRGVVPGLRMPRIGLEYEEARRVGCKLRVALRLADRVFGGLDRARDLIRRRAGDNEVVALGAVALAPAGADGCPQAR